MPHRVAMLATASLVAACSHGPVSPQLRDPGLDLTLDKQEASSGDSVGYSITFSFVDAPGDPVYLHIGFDGKPTVWDTLAVPASQKPLTGAFVVPANLAAGTLTVTVFMPKRQDSTSADIRITPHSPTRSLSIVVRSPAMPAVFTTSPFNRVLDFIAGSVDTLVLTAKDNAGVAWVGWALGPPANLRDSVSVSGTSVVTTFPLAVPGGASGASRASPGALDVFARSQDGTLTDTSYTIGGVAEYLDRPVRSVALMSTVQDMVYDPKRDVVYLVEQGQAGVVVLSLAGMIYATPIALPGQAAGLDLVPSSDSLVVAIAGTDDLAIIDLTSAAHTMNTVHLGNLAPYTIVFPRVAMDRRVLLELGSHGGGVGDYNLLTGIAQLYDSSADGSVPVRSGDGSIVVMRDVGGCGLAEYDATNKTFMFYIETCGEQFPGQIAASQTGTRLNIGVELLNGGLASLGWAEIPDAPLVLGVTDGAAVSPSGNDFYVVVPALCGGVACPQTAPGFYFRFALSGDATPTMTPLEIVDTPETPVQLLPIPGGQSMLAVGPTKLMLFDLTQSSPASFRYAATGHGAPPRGAARRSR
jgi:hypothetical protein